MLLQRALAEAEAFLCPFGKPRAFLSIFVVVAFLGFYNWLACDHPPWVSLALATTVANNTLEGFPSGGLVS